MNRTSTTWLAAAGGVVVLTVIVVLVFGLTPPPSFPSLYDEGTPTIEGMVAYVDYDRDECVVILDVATGESQKTLCDDFVWLEGWDDDGNLRIHFDNGSGEVNAIDPDTGELKHVGDVAGLEPAYEPSLRSSSRDGHAVLTYTTDGSAVTLIDVDGPRQYAFWQYGLTADGAHAWVGDSEDRLLVVAVDGTGGPWIVAEDVNEVVWR